MSKEKYCEGIPGYPCSYREEDGIHVSGTCSIEQLLLLMIQYKLGTPDPEPLEATLVNYEAFVETNGCYKAEEVTKLLNTIRTIISE
jgi:hypothetical protein